MTKWTTFSTPKPPKRVNAESLLAAYSFQKINQNRIFTSEVNQNEEADQNTVDNSNTESNAENTNSEAEGSNEESETVSEDTSSEENTDNSDNAE